MIKNLIGFLLITVASLDVLALSGEELSIARTNLQILGVTRGSAPGAFIYSMLDRPEVDLSFQPIRRLVTAPSTVNVGMLLTAFASKFRSEFEAFQRSLPTRLAEARPASSFGSSSMAPPPFFGASDPSAMAPTPTPPAYTPPAPPSYTAYTYTATATPPAASPYSLAPQASPPAPLTAQDVGFAGGNPGHKGFAYPVHDGPGHIMRGRGRVRTAIDLPKPQKDPLPNGDLILQELHRQTNLFRDAHLTPVQRDVAYIEMIIQMNDLFNRDHTRFRLDVNITKAIQEITEALVAINNELSWFDQAGNSVYLPSDPRQHYAFGVRISFSDSKEIRRIELHTLRLDIQNILDHQKHLLTSVQKQSLEATIPLLQEIIRIVGTYE